MNAFFVIPIPPTNSSSRLQSSNINLPRYENYCSTYSILPFVSILYYVHLAEQNFPFFFGSTNFSETMIIIVISMCVECFHRITFENDIALLRLETPLLYTESVSQLSLPHPLQNFTGGLLPPHSSLSLTKQISYITY